jgi:hypothetical protein
MGPQLFSRAPVAVAVVAIGCGIGPPYKTSPGPLSAWDAEWIVGAHLVEKIDDGDPGHPVPYLAFEPGRGSILFATNKWNRCTFCTEPVVSELTLELPGSLTAGQRLVLFANGDHKGGFSEGSLGWGRSSEHVAGYVTVAGVSGSKLDLELELVASRFEGRDGDAYVDLRGPLRARRTTLAERYR